MADDTNSPKYESFRQFISQFISGPNADALINSLADEAQKGEELSIAITDQLFISTAQGDYLDKKLGDKGITRPPELGMDDLAFRNMGIQINATKQIPEILNTVLATFYGPDAVRAWTESTLPEPYDLEAGMDLVLQLENGELVIITIQESDFLDIGQATAGEVADVITRFFKIQDHNGFAQSIEDPDTGDKYVRIFGGAQGPYSMINVIGGEIQNKLEFPNMRGTELQLNDTIWEVTKTVGDTIRFRWTAGSQPALDKVIVNDRALIYGPGFKLYGLEGTFTVTNVRPPVAAPAYDSGWFEVTNSSVSGLKNSLPDQAPPINDPGAGLIYSWTINQLSYEGLKFFQIKKTAPYLQSRYALAFEPDEGLLKIYLPATTRIIERNLKGAAHLHNLYTDGNFDGAFGSATDDSLKLVVLNDYSIRYKQAGYDNYGSGGELTYDAVTKEIDYIYRENGHTTIKTVEPHGITGTTLSGASGHRHINIIAINQSGTTVTVTTDGSHGVAIGSKVIISETSNFNGFCVVTAAPNTNIFEFQSINPVSPPETSGLMVLLSKGVILSDKIITVSVERVAADHPDYPFLGPYMVDTEVDYTLTAVYHTLKEKIKAGEIKKTLFVKGLMPNIRGRLLFDLGQDTEEGPIDYFGSQIANAPTTAPIRSIAQVGTTVTVTTTKPHGAIVGSKIIVSGTTNFNGQYTVTSVPTSTTFKFTRNPPATYLENAGQITLIVEDISSTLILDPSYIFKHDHEVDSEVALLSSTKAYVPDEKGTDYAPYVTGTAEGRVFAENLIEQITAFGISLEIIIVYPSDIGLGNEGGSDSLDDPPTSDKIFVWGTDDL